MRATISIVVFPDPAKPATQSVPNIPWYPGVTVLDAMILADAISEATFKFRVVYASLYGAFVDKIGDTEDQGDSYWVLYIDGQEAKVGVSESLLIEQPGQNVEIAWKFQASPIPHAVGSQVEKKAKAVALK